MALDHPSTLLRRTPSAPMVLVEQCRSTTTIKSLRKTMSRRLGPVSIVGTLLLRRRRSKSLRAAAPVQTTLPKCSNSRASTTEDRLCLPVGQRLAQAIQYLAHRAHQASTPQRFPG